MRLVSVCAWLITLSFLACAPENEDIPGRYVARYQWGTDTLELRGDLTFKQVVEGGGSPAESAMGTWRIERRGVDTRILLTGCLYGHDTANASRRPSKKGACDIGVERWWGTLGIGWAGVAPWKKVDE